MEPPPPLPPRKRPVGDSIVAGGGGDSGAVDLVLATSIGNGEDLGPTVRHAFESGKPESLVHQLRIILKKKEVEIEELCRLHYEEFIVAVDELRGVLVDAEELKHSLSSENHRLQYATFSLLSTLNELIETCSIKSNVASALQTSHGCAKLLILCSTCNSHVSERRFFHALKTLDLIEKSYKQSVPVKSLRKVIEQQIPAIKYYIERAVCREFNDWLVHIRSSAKEIGQLAIAQATSARQRATEQQQQRSDGSTVIIYEDDEAFVEFDLTPVYRAHHIHDCLGATDRFRDYYYKNRLMQLNLDLQISTVQPFLESHQPFFAQIAGYFIVEDRVLRTAGGLLSESQVETIWETAVSKMTAVLEAQFSNTATASHLLLVKDFVTLLGATLRRYGYRVDPLLDVLDSSRDKYHELLLQECRNQIADILANDTYAQLVIRKEYEYNMNVVSFNLHSSDSVPYFPYIAPFSASVPDICRTVRSFIEDSVSYLSYGGGGVTFFEFVKRYLDKLLIEVINDALLNLVHGGSLGLSQAMQVTANIGVLEGACDYFLVQAGHNCGVPSRIVEKPNATLNAKAVLKASQNAAYNGLLDLTNSKLDEFMALANNINWIADEAPVNANEYMNEVLNYLDTILSSAQQILPPDALYKIGTGAMEHISDSIVAAFLSDFVKRFTQSAVCGIDNDLKMLESFADDRYQLTGLTELKKERTFRDCLVESRQLVNLLLSNQPENFMNPVIREKNYGALDYKKVANICDKFKDSPDSLFGSLSNRTSKQSARKKSMDTLKKRLKDFNW